MVTVERTTLLAEDGSERGARAAETIDDMLTTLLKKGVATSPPKSCGRSWRWSSTFGWAAFTREWFEEAEVEIALLEDEG